MRPRAGRSGPSKSTSDCWSNTPSLPATRRFVHRQYGIANLYLAGKWFRLWTYIPLPPSMGRTATMYEKIVKNGPYSDVAPEAQLKLGAAREKQKDFPAAAKAFEVAAERYHDRPKIAAEALFREGQAYNRQALRADYDQSTAGKAIECFADFTTLYPGDARVGQATNTIAALKKEQALGCLQSRPILRERQVLWQNRPMERGAHLLQRSRAPGPQFRVCGLGPQTHRCLEQAPQGRPTNDPAFAR